VDRFLNKITQGDCLELMREMPDKSVDLVLTDPPYGINENDKKVASRGNLAKPIDYGCFEWDKNKVDRKYFREISRISLNWIIWGGNYYANYFVNSPCWLVWYKNNGTNDFADCELAYTSFKTAVRFFKYTWNGMIQENMGKDKEIKEHPTQKPLNLFKWCLDKYSEPGQTILDPFSGSGTTAIACHDLKRNFICIEKEPKYIALSQQRLENARAQLELF